MIKIIAVGNIKENYLKEAMEEYRKRINKFTNIKIIEIKEEGKVEQEKALELEQEKIKRYLEEKDYIITLEIDGQEISSVELAQKIDKILIEHSTITFVIGGSYGLSDKIKENSQSIQNYR